MLKKMSIVSVVLFSVILSSNFASSAVLGIWDVNSTLTAKASFKGHSGSDSAAFSDAFRFDSDGTFHMISMDGTWTEPKKKFTVYLAPSLVAHYLETTLTEALEWYGIYAEVTDVTLTKNSFSGTESKDGKSIKGKYTLQIGFYISIPDFGIEGKGKASATANFTGTRTGASATLDENALPEGMESLIEMIGEMVMESISSQNPVSNP